MLFRSIETVAASSAKTGALLVADCAPDMASMGHVLLSQLLQQGLPALRQAPRLIAYPNHPVPTTPFLANHYYPGAAQIAATALTMLGLDDLRDAVAAELASDLPADQPDRRFVGPF